MRAVERVEAAARDLVARGVVKIMGAPIVEASQGAGDEDKGSCPFDCVSGCAYCDWTGIVFGSVEKVP